MNFLRGLGPLTHAALLQTLRSRTAMFWNVLFPLIWLFLFGFIFGQGDPARVSVLMPGLFTITIISGSFFGVSYIMVSERETGILRRYRVSPVSATTVVLANSIRALTTLSLSVTIQATVGYLVFGYTMRGSLLLMALMMLLGAAAFVPLGLIVGSVAQDMRTAPAISNLLFFPLVFGSGAAFPYWMLPDWVQALGRLVPSSYLVEALQGVMLRGLGLFDLAAPISVLVLTGTVGAALNALLFRWESSEPVNRRGLLITVLVLVALLAAAALTTPAFQMATAPGRG